LALGYPASRPQPRLLEALFTVSEDENRLALCLTFLTSRGVQALSNEFYCPLVQKCLGERLHGGPALPFEEYVTLLKQQARSEYRQYLQTHRRLPSKTPVGLSTGQEALREDRLPGHGWSRDRASCWLVPPPEAARKGTGSYLKSHLLGFSLSPSRRKPVGGLVSLTSE